MAFLGDLGAAVQDASEAEPDTLGFYGQEIRVSRTIGLMPLLKFAAVAKSNVTTDDMEGMAAIHTMIGECIDPRDWDLFQQLAVDNHANEEVLMEVVRIVIEAATARPTSKPSDSADGLATTGESTRAVSYSRELDGLTLVDQGV